MEGPKPNVQIPTPPKPSGAARFLSFVRAVTVQSVALGVIFAAAQYFAPEHLKPSTLIGDFNGRIDTAEIDAKIAAAVRLAREQAEAQAVPPAIAEMETEAFRVQQGRLSHSLEGQSTTANLLDYACIAGVIAQSFESWKDVGSGLTQTCGMSDKIRRNMVDILVEGGQTGDTVIRRTTQPAPADRLQTRQY